jgi:ATP-dependent protease ClpP protease subunit
MSTPCKKPLPKSNELGIEIQNPFTKQKNIQVAEDKERNLAVLKIYGTIEEPEEYIEELAKLEILSKNYDVLEITLNSPGGSLNTTVDIASIIRNFTYVATIGKGEIASAAFMLWTMGDIRVVTDYSMYMAHRESYGMYGKTSEHRDTAKTFGLVYEEMFENCFGTLLTDIEKSVAERSETWISYKDLIGRDKVIGYDTYIKPINPYSIAETYITESGKMFMYDTKTDAYRSIDLTFGDEILTDMTEYLYGVTKVAKLPKPKKITKPKAAKRPTKTVKETVKENVKLSKGKTKKGKTK